MNYKSVAIGKVTNFYPLIIHGKYNNRWSGCVDCGIDRGAYSKSYSSFFDNVVSIDAIVRPEAHETLSCLPNVSIINQCLSGVTGDNVTFYEIVDDPALNTLHKAFLYHNLSNLDNVEVVEHKLTTIKLDDILALPNQVDFLKTDCEGADADILVGAASIINRCRPTIVTEPNNSMIDRFMWSINYERRLIDEEYCVDAIYLPSEVLKK
jgi:FkbM family methyltransferase